jgi:hypothetical protein
MTRTSATSALQRNDEELYQELTAYLTEGERRAVEALADQVLTAAGGAAGLARHRIMVAFGGGMDS